MSADRTFVDTNVFTYLFDDSELSFWDALIVRAAAGAGCGLVLSEDLSDGQVLDGVRIENPFRL